MIGQHYNELPSEMDIPILKRDQNNSPQGREHAGTIRGNRHTVIPTPGIHVVGLSWSIALGCPDTGS